MEPVRRVGEWKEGKETEVETESEERKRSGDFMNGARRKRKRRVGRKEGRQSWRHEGKEERQRWKWNGGDYVTRENEGR